MAFDRRPALARLAEEQFDVLVVGGGITGVGAALDAATRGLRTALVEREDFASGTSSRSSKLVHGGLRYLQQGDVRLVYQALAERERLRRNAPHLVELLPFLIPLQAHGGVVNRRLRRGMSAALWAYDLTGGARIGRFHERVSREEALERFPTLREEGLLGGFVYHDARTDDARLTLTVARTAADHGAVVANRVALTRFEDGRASVETAEGDQFEVRTTVLVNASGVWTAEVQGLGRAAPTLRVRPAKGVHITVPWHRVRNTTAAVVPVPGERRTLFVIPYGERTVIGTTDTDYEGSLDRPTCTDDDVRYVLDAVNASLVEPLTPDDVVATWAGLRPLVQGAGTRTADLSRRHRVTANGGMVTVTGGKLTTYRAMAADTIDLVSKLLGRRTRSVTKRLPLHGATMITPEGDELQEHLTRRYGADADLLRRTIEHDPTLGEPLIAGLPYRRAEALHAARHEMALTLEDILRRRVPGQWLDRTATAEAAEGTARLVAAELGWDDQRVRREVAAFGALDG